MDTRELSELGSSHQSILCCGSSQAPFNENVSLPAEIKPVKDQDEGLHPRYRVVQSSAGVSYPLNLGSSKSSRKVQALKLHIENNTSLISFLFPGLRFLRALRLIQFSEILQFLNILKTR